MLNARYPRLVTLLRAEAAPERPLLTPGLLCRYSAVSAWPTETERMFDGPLSTTFGCGKQLMLTASMLLPVWRRGVHRAIAPQGGEIAVDRRHTPRSRRRSPPRKPKQPVVSRATRPPA